jgi:hypothetical protein
MYVFCQHCQTSNSYYEWSTSFSARAGLLILTSKPWANQHLHWYHGKNASKHYKYTFLGLNQGLQVQIYNVSASI